MTRSKEAIMSSRRQSPAPKQSAQPVWKLQDAKAHFSQLVRSAQQQGPQRVTVHGKEAVVVVSAADYARLAPKPKKPNLYELLSQSPLRDLDFEFESVRWPVRDFEL
jgi:prevent-host-death family protein